MPPAVRLGAALDVGGGGYFGFAFWGCRSRGCGGILTIFRGSGFGLLGCGHIVCYLRWVVSGFGMCGLLCDIFKFHYFTNVFLKIRITYYRSYLHGVCMLCGMGYTFGISVSRASGWCVACPFSGSFGFNFGLGGGVAGVCLVCEGCS